MTGVGIMFPTAHVVLADHGVPAIVLGIQGIVNADRGMARLAARVGAAGALTPVPELMDSMPHGFRVGLARVVPHVGDRPGPVHVRTGHPGQLPQGRFQALQFGGAEALPQGDLDNRGLTTAH
jgi:hypothetical protein